jgi:protein phosphatase PTC2/3
MVTSFPDVVIKPFHKDVEFLVLACDGIWDCKTSEEVIQHYSQALPEVGQKDIHKTNHSLLDEICPDTLKEMIAADGNGSDNMTVIIIDFLKHSGGSNGKKVSLHDQPTSSGGGGGGKIQKKTTMKYK